MRNPKRSNANAMKKRLLILLMAVAASMHFAEAQVEYTWRLEKDSNGNSRWVHDEFPDRGHWVLTKAELRGYPMMVGQNMIDDLNYWPWKNSVAYPKKTPYYDGDWKIEKNSASCGLYSINWGDPPDKIPVGQEYRAVIPFSTTCEKIQVWDPINVIPMGDTEGKERSDKTVYQDFCQWCVYGQMYTLSKWGRIQRREQMWQYDWNEYYYKKDWLYDEGYLPDQKIPSGSTDLLLMAAHDYLRPSLNTESLKDKQLHEFVIEIFAHYDFHSDPSYDGVDPSKLRKNYCWMYSYRYTYVPPGGLIEVTTEASENDGEQKGPEIPWYFIVGGVAAVAGGVAIAKGGKKKDDKDEDDDRATSSYQMILYKNFGDTLVVGDKPKTIGARIEEITSKGERIDRTDLTAQISIFDEENCKLSNIGMSGRYMAAGVVAKEAPKEGKLGEAKVRFVFKGANGVLINHVVFKVMGEPEIVIGDSLTFEAGGGKTQFMEFQICNFTGSVLGVQVTIDNGGASYFREETEPNKENPLKYRLNFTECGAKPGPDDIAGDAKRFTCGVSVKLEGRDEPLKASFDIYRMNLGVTLLVHALKGYLVDFDSSYKSEVLATDPKKRKKWGESRASFKLIVEDQKTKEIKSVVPDTEPVFTFEDVEEGSLIFIDRFGNQISNPCQLMNFKFDTQHIDDDNTVVGIIRSHGGGLLPPNRAKAKVTVTVGYQGKTYTDSVFVPIISQPYRDISDNREYSRVLKEDEKKLDQLMKLRSKITLDPRFSELIPYYYKVNAMIEGYSNEFGFYEPDYQRMMRIFDEYCSGKIGHYFVNNSAWTPEWSAADENLDAFVATFGEIERSWTGLGCRIALGFLTAGASELVFTPASGLVKLKNYVDKGGDSAYEGFKTVSKEILIWEGVFYVGGEIFKWGAPKVKDFADKKGITSKLKQGYEKIKETILGTKQSKDVSKGLSGASSYNTKQLGDKVKQAGEQAKQAEKAAASKANEAIHSALEEGDDVVRFGSSEFNEECAKWAKKDAEKILENFKKVMNDPTATPEQMRSATLALQGNKAAQNLLRESSSDLLRANFNANLKKIYSDVDKLTREELAARLGVQMEDIRVWDGASSNAAQDLYLGKKIGADRDVTFQIRGKDGKWVDIREDIMEQAYANCFTEYHFGFLPKDQQEAVKTLRKLDLAVVNGETGLESFGKDLPNIIVKDLQTSKLIDPEKVANTVKYKCEFWTKQGKACREQAEQLFNAGLVDEAKHVMGYGEELVKEGVRMNVKEFKRILQPRLEALRVKGITARKYEILREKIRILDAVGTPPPKDVTPLSLEQARLVLQNKYNTTLEAVVEECTNAIQDINPYL